MSEPWFERRKWPQKKLRLCNLYSPFAAIAVADFCHLISWGINWMWRRGRRSGQRRRESEMNTWGTDRSIHKCTIMNSLPPFESLKVQLINGSACHSRFLSISSVRQRPRLDAQIEVLAVVGRIGRLETRHITRQMADCCPSLTVTRNLSTETRRKLRARRMKAEKPLLRMLYFFPLIWCARCVEAKAVLFARNELQFLQLIFKNR